MVIFYPKPAIKVLQCIKRMIMLNTKMIDEATLLALPSYVNNLNACPFTLGKQEINAIFILVAWPFQHIRKPHETAESAIQFLSGKQLNC